MSENKRTLKQILEEANDFFEKAGGAAALEGFLNSESVKQTVDHFAKLFEEEISVESVCLGLVGEQHKITYRFYVKMDSEEVAEPQPMTVENCGESKCLYDEDCRELGFCLKGKEFHCNGKGKDSGKCNCPGFLSCVPGLYYPCEELNFTVIPPEGGCGECGVN